MEQLKTYILFLTIGLVALAGFAYASPVITLPAHVGPSGTYGQFKVNVVGTGFAPNTHINLGYASNFPPDANAIFATTTNSTGGWTGSFSAPWHIGTYKMVAIGLNDVEATAQLIVASPTPTLILSQTTPSSKQGLVNVTVSGIGFTPNTLVSLGYSSNFPPYPNAIFATRTNSTGGWTGIFHAPWHIGTYNMTAIDAWGFTANATLVVT